jgi:hypothetical protein
MVRKATVGLVSLACAVFLATPLRAARLGSAGPLSGSWVVTGTAHVYKDTGDKPFTTKFSVPMDIVESGAGVDSEFTATFTDENSTMISLNGLRFGTGFVMFTTSPYYIEVSGQATIVKGVAKSFTGEGSDEKASKLERIKVNGKRPKT